MLDAKDYLKQIRIADKKIRAKERELKTMIIQATTVSSCGMSEKVQSSGNKDRVSEAVIKIELYKEKLNKDITDLLNIKSKIMKKIDLLQDADEIDILYKRYFEFKKWEEISEESNFSERQVHNIHGSALENFKKIMTADEWIEEEEKKNGK